MQRDSQDREPAGVAGRVSFSVIRNVSVALRHFHARGAEHLLHPLAFGGGSSTQVVFLRIGPDAQYLLGRFEKIDFSPGTGNVMKLELGKDQSNIFSGEVSREFKVTPPFKFEGG